MALVGKVKRKIDERTYIYRYVIELQPKRSGEFSTLIVWNKEQTEILDEFLEAIFHDFIEVKSAKVQHAKHYQVLWGRLRHTTEFTSVDDQSKHFVDRIFEAKHVH